jgi:hypothetical protein
MSRVTLVVLAVLAVTALAGCSKAPPSGELSGGASGVTIDGNGIVDYTAAQYPAGSVPVVGPSLCSPVPQAPPQTQCVPASSSFTIHFMALPDPAGATYEVVLANASGELPLGALTMDANNMWEINKTFEGEDYTGSFDRLELRLGDVVLATAPAGEGTNTFTLDAGLSGISATGTYSGKVLNVTVTGLPANGTYTGYLYTLDEVSGLLTRAEPFTVRNGANEHTAPQDIATYAEFHIHLGTSMVNLYKMTIAAA